MITLSKKEIADHIFSKIFEDNFSESHEYIEISASGNCFMFNHNDKEEYSHVWPEFIHYNNGNKSIITDADSCHGTINYESTFTINDHMFLVKFYVQENNDESDGFDTMARFIGTVGEVENNKFNEVLPKYKALLGLVGYDYPDEDIIQTLRLLQEEGYDILENKKLLVDTI